MQVTKTNRAAILRMILSEIINISERTNLEFIRAGKINANVWIED